MSGWQNRILPSRTWWLAMLLIVLCASVLRYTGYNFSLPYVDHPDEAAYNIAARMIVDFGSPKPIGMQGYPPGIIAVNLIFIRFFHDPALPPVSVLGMVRLVSITFSVLCVIMVGLLAYRVAGSFAGLLAAGLWAVAPIIVEFSRYASSDNFVTFFALLSLFLTLTGTRFNRNDAIYGGLIAILLAIIFKYQAIFLLPLIIALPLIRLFTQTAPRGSILKTFAIAIIICALFGFWLVVLFPALEVGSSPYFSASSERLSIPTPAVLLENLQMTLGMIAPLWQWLAGWLGLIVFFTLPHRRFADRLAVLTIGSAGVLWLVGISFYGVLGSQEFRQFISFGALATIMLGVGWMGWALLLTSVFGRLSLALRRNLLQHFSTAAIVIALLVVLIGWQSIQASISNAQEHTLPDRRNDLAHYMDGSLEPAPFIATIENHKTLNPSWGGYAGAHQFPFAGLSDLETQPLDTWREEGIEYAIISDFMLNLMRDNQQGRDNLAQMLILKTYPPSSNYRGPSMSVLRTERMQYEIDAQLSIMHFVGYEILPDERIYHPGEQITTRYFWKADSPTDGEYAVFNHLVDAETGELVAQVDGDPLAGSRPTSEWDDPTEILVSRPFVLTLPIDIEPGEYVLRVGFYRRDTGDRLLMSEGESYLEVASIQVGESE